MQKQKKILIVSNHFPPLNSMAAKRYGYMCKYLEKYGYKPYVITMHHRKGSYLEVKLDLPITIPREQIIYVGQSGRKYPIKQLGWSIVCSHLSRKKLWARAVDETALGWYGKIRDTIQIEDLQDIDIVLGTFPSVDNIYAAKYIAKKLGVPFVAEIRDLISDYEETLPGLTRANGIDKFFEAILLGNADGIVAVTQGFCEILKRRYFHIDTVAVYNGWDSRDIQKAYGNRETKYLYYAGSLYEHRVESLQLLMEVLEEDEIPKDLEIRIRSVGPKRLEKKLENAIGAKRLQDRVKLLPAATEAVVRQEQNGAYINLIPSSIHADDSSLMTTLPGKLFELLVNEAPILAIVPPISEVSEILNATEKGIASTDKIEIKEFLLNAGEGYKGNEKVNFYSRENQAKELCLFLDGILKGKNKFRRKKSYE